MEILIIVLICFFGLDIICQVITAKREVEKEIEQRMLLERLYKKVKRLSGESDEDEPFSEYDINEKN